VHEKWECNVCVGVREESECVRAGVAVSENGEWSEGWVECGSRGCVWERKQNTRGNSYRKKLLKWRKEEKGVIKNKNWASIIIITIFFIFYFYFQITM